MKMLNDKAYEVAKRKTYEYIKRKPYEVVKRKTGGQAQKDRPHRPSRTVSPNKKRPDGGMKKLEKYIRALNLIV